MHVSLQVTPAPELNPGCQDEDITKFRHMLVISFSAYSTYRETSHIIFPPLVYSAVR